MLRQIFFTLLLTGLFFSGISQQSKFEYGFQAGVNASSLYGSANIKDITDGQTGLSIGGQVKLNTSAHFGIKAGLSYDEYGWSYPPFVLESNLFNNTTTTLSYKIHYLNLPLMAEYSFGKKVKIHLAGGTFVGVLVGNKTIEKVNGSGSVNQQTITNNNSQYNKINFGLTAGTGVEIPIASKIAIDINVKNATGLTNITGRDSFKITAFSFLGGLIFKI